MKVFMLIVCLLLVVAGSSSARELELRWLEFQDHLAITPNPDNSDWFPGYFEATFQVVDAADPTGPPVTDFFYVGAGIRHGVPVHSGWWGWGIWFCGSYGFPPEVIHEFDEVSGTFHLEFTAFGGILYRHYTHSYLSIVLYDSIDEEVVELESPAFIVASPDFAGADADDGFANILHVDLADFSRFGSLYGTSDPYADYVTVGDSEGIVDLADFSKFGQAFGDRCSESE